MTAKAESQRFLTREVRADRGTILFSDNSVLASSQPSFLVFVQPKLIDQKYPSLADKKDYAQKVAEIFFQKDKQDREIIQSLDGQNTPEASDPAKEAEDENGKMKVLQATIFDNISKDLYWVSLGRTVDLETKLKLEKLGLAGIGFEASTSRFYPEGSSSAHLLGFIGSDAYGEQTGYFGLEGFYNGELKGKEGSITQEKDAMGLPILIGKFVSKDPKAGKTLVLNVDRAIQHIVEQKLHEGMQKYGAKSGSVVVMEPKTGAIVAMASLPSYDPGNPAIYPKENFKNPITADSYEPGSTFKVLVMASAVNEGLVTPETVCDICSGPVNIANYTIRTWNNQYDSNSTMTDTIVHSDNTGMVFVSKKLGIDKMYDYIKKFGFGVITGVDLQDESSPDLRKKDDWKEIDLATSSFGQGISVTPLQIARAVSAIANGGKLMEPHVVKEIKSDSGVIENKPRVVEQAVSEQTAKTITEMMVQAVNLGEAKFFKPKGFKIAGKTGTAQIPVAGHYDPTKTVASFVGFAPADDPKFVMLVRYDQPSSSIYGAETAAPTFFAIAKELFTYYGIAPTE